MHFLELCIRWSYESFPILIPATLKDTTLHAGRGAFRYLGTSSSASTCTYPSLLLHASFRSRALRIRARHGRNTPGNSRVGGAARSARLQLASDCKRSTKVSKDDWILRTWAAVWTPRSSRATSFIRVIVPSKEEIDAVQSTQGITAGKNGFNGPRRSLAHAGACAGHPGIVGKLSHQGIESSGQLEGQRYPGVLLSSQSQHFPWSIHEMMSGTVICTNRPDWYLALRERVTENALPGQGSHRFRRGRLVIGVSGA